MEIVWDERKRRINLDKHGLDFADLDATFFATAKIVHGRGRRSVAIGRLHGVTTVVFLWLGSEGLSVISMRPASAKERRSL